ncbi:methyltransferase domain-containing protein [Desulfonatronovibrio hydrogenovorans]|uniref:methyltransferase domain-containing protein n=1 Tax=Desulfonatronovibrio hydrogenovorans TaxID=53245 RepID=UPI000691FB1E|nr:methyltransferase domain-containing protein [Desulfonatronovibrio hydrogenovorans]
MSHDHPARYLAEHLDLVLETASGGPVLDLACGSGRNGLYLAEQGLEVHFWDRDRQGLEQIRAKAVKEHYHVKLRQVDLEDGSGSLLPVEFFRAVLVFRYLYRPLIRQIKGSVIPGGLVVYETFTAWQAKVGKPKNPDFLLQENELVEFFQDWDILDCYQGRLDDPERYMAGLVARKPVKYS